MTIGSAGDLEAMRVVGRLVAETLDAMQREVRVGIRTDELDAVAERFARRAGARSAPQLAYDFPGFTCISVNEEIVHGIPGQRMLRPGDVLKLDVTLELHGYMADAARTVLVPPATLEAQQLRRCARTAFNRGLAVVRTGTAIREIGRAVEAEARRAGFAVLRQLSGHGIGRSIHEDPPIPNYADPMARGTLTEGLVMTIEPMVATRPARPVEAPDGWTLRTHNRALAAHHEHTIIVRRGQAEVLTAA